MMRRRFPALALGMLLLFTAGAQAEDLRSYSLTVQNGRFMPATIEVPAGAKFKIMLTNLGPGPEEFESTELNKEKVLGEGVTRPIIFAPLKPGRYKFFGEFHPQTAQGQIIVK